MAGISTGTGFAANVGSNTLSSLWNKIFQVVEMVRGLPTAVRDMNVQVQRLKDVTDDINADLAREQRNAKKIVQNWLNKAGWAIQRSESINNEYEQHKTCLGCCPDCFCRYRISKDIKAWNLTVDKLHSEKQSDFPPSGVYGNPTPPTQIPIQHPELAGNGIKATQSYLEWLLTDKDINIRRIGIHGMGGVGKSSLLDTINDSQKVKDSFELIIKVTVSKNHMLDLQTCVAKRLNLRFPDNLEELKDMLLRSLKDKKFLLLLDDIWADSALWMIDDLQNLGVPLDNTGFKIVLTTRDKEVCARMNVQEILTVEPLLEEEGWELFRKRAFQNRDAYVPQEIEEVARQIAKECKGLPLALIVVAAAMAHHTDLHEWGVALDQMQNVPAAFCDLHPGVDERFFQRLKWSYDALKLHDLKICFLSFAAYPEDRVINCTEVIDMWIAESLVKGSRETYLHDTGHSYINQLRNRCLIEVVKTDMVGRIKEVKMHDILRDLAIRIAETEHRCYFKAGQGLSHFPLDEIDGKDCARLSFVYNKLDSLPTSFACSSLSVLLLRENCGIKEVSGSFLRELSSLKVLDLSETGITSLPPSIGNLKRLAALQLRRTGICELPETIGDLKNLQLLNISFCLQIRCLPERISELKHLRALDTQGCRLLSHLPRGISKLVSLERLRMDSSNISLYFEEEANTERTYACVKDLQTLRCLRVLSVKLKSPVKEGVIGNWSKMRALWLWFDDGVNQDYLPQDMQAMKDLVYFTVGGSNLERLPSWVSEFRRLGYLYLGFCKQLRELELGMGFPKLEELSLIGLKSLECVSVVAAASGSGGLGDGVYPLPMLKSVPIYDCKKLKTLVGRWDKLQCLEEIRGEREWWDAIQWEDPNMRTSLENKLKSWPGL